MKNSTLMILLVDRSYSMNSIKDSTEEAINSFIHEQRQQTSDEMFLTTIQFNEHYEVLYAQKPIQEVPTFKLNPAGKTAYFDALVRAIDDTGVYLNGLPEAERPMRVLFVTMTDGEENASTRYSATDVNLRIKHQTEIYSWRFMYLGANQDSIQVAQNLGMDVNFAATFAASGANVIQTINYMTQRVSSYRDQNIMRGFVPSERKNMMETQTSPKEKTKSQSSASNR